MSEQKRDDSIGALWARVSQNGRRYMTGKIDGVGDVVAFENERKSGKQPDWRIFRQKPRDGQSPSTQRLDTRESDRRPSRVDDTDDLIPF